MAQVYPDAVDDLNGCAGALIVTDTNERAFAVFRSEITLDNSSAGRPQMTVTRTEGVNRLAQRSSFSIHLQAAKSRSHPWIDEDLYTAERLWPALNMVGRQSHAKMLIKQKEEMTDERNHSVRNMLALVRSISKQTRRQNPPVIGYGKSPEARSPALATAHELCSGSTIASASLHEMILQELKSVEKNPKPQINVNHDDHFIVADSAPLFPLGLHEFCSDALTFGARSHDEGQVTVILVEADEGIEITSTETGGPSVEPPRQKGFGPILIEKALPFEMGGSTTLRFDPGGVV